MKNINKAVKRVKEFGTKGAMSDFELIYSNLQPTVEKRVNKYLDRKFPYMPLDRDNVTTYCLYEWLERIINSYDEAKGDFHPFYFGTLNRGILNAVQPQLTKSNEPNIQCVTLNLDVEEGTTLLDLIPDEVPQEDFSFEMEEKINQFRRQHGEQAYQVIMCLAMEDGQDRTDLLCQIYGETDYSPKLRKRVERVKKAFAQIL